MKRNCLFIALLCVGAVKIAYPVHGVQQSLATLARDMKKLTHALAASPQFKITPPTNLLLSSAINYRAPEVVPVPLEDRGNTIDIMQLIVAWQDLPLTAFVGINNWGAVTFGFQQGFIHNFMSKSLTDPFLDNLLQLLRDHNHDLFTQLKKREKEIIESPEFRKLYIGGGDASCGYHSVKNGLLIVDAIVGADEVNRKKSIEKLLDLKYLNGLFGLPPMNAMVNGSGINGEWRELILTLKKTKTDVCESNGDWLTDNAIKYLWEHVLSKQLHDKNIFFELYRSSGASTQDGRLEANEKLLDFAGMRTKYANRESFIGVVIINPPSHYYSVVFNNIVTAGKNHLQVIIVDSKNVPRYAYDGISGSGVFSYFQEVLHIITGIPLASVSYSKQLMIVRGVHQSKQLSGDEQKYVDRKSGVAQWLFNGTPPDEILKEYSKAGAALTEEEIEGFGLIDKAQREKGLKVLADALGITVEQLLEGQKKAKAAAGPASVAVVPAAVGQTEEEKIAAIAKELGMSVDDYNKLLRS